MIRDEILEYPYRGTITRIIPGEGREKDSQSIIYEGVMDEHMVEKEIGSTLQTSSYIISIPLTKNASGGWIVPIKGDEISLVRYGEAFTLTVDNAEPSQIGGVSIYATRKDW